MMCRIHPDRQSSNTVPRPLPGQTTVPVTACPEYCPLKCPADCPRAVRPQAQRIEVTWKNGPHTPPTFRGPFCSASTGT
jgi:hypothetical protein